MAAATGDLGNQFCTLCEEESINNLAVSWCTDCETFLCSDCKKHHGRNKASKEHKTISVKDYKELPTFINNTSLRCKEHEERLEFYCSLHQAACCIDCITKDHNECKELKKLTNVLKDFKTSSSIAHTEDDLRDLRENFDKVTKYLSSKLVDIDAKKMKGKKQIKDMRKSIDSHLDKLEQKLLDDLDDKHIEIKTSIENLLKGIEKKKSQTDQLDTDFNKTKKFATELQTYVGIKEIDRMTNEMVNYLTGTKRKDLVVENYMEIELCSDILEVKSLGKIKVSTVPVSLQLTLRKELQICSQVQIPINVNQIKPKLLKKISLGSVSEVFISGCQILPNGQMLFIDQRGSHLKLYSKDGLFLRNSVSFDKKPYDVTYIKDNTVAVTTVNDKEVHFVDFERNTILKSIMIPCKCKGIDSDGENIRINCGNEKCIISLEIDGKSEFPSRMISSDSSDIATFGENIYISEYSENKVKCLSKNGDVLWTYQLMEGRHPRGLSVDKHGFVYVACLSRDNVTVISPNGNNGCAILTQDNGMLTPFALNINTTTSTLLVANRDNGEAFLYQI